MEAPVLTHGASLFTVSTGLGAGSRTRALAWLLNPAAATAGSSPTSQPRLGGE